LLVQTLQAQQNHTVSFDRRNRKGDRRRVVVTAHHEGRRRNLRAAGRRCVGDRLAYGAPRAMNCSPAPTRKAGVDTGYNWPYQLTPDRFDTFPQLLARGLVCKLRSAIGVDYKEGDGEAVDEALQGNSVLKSEIFSTCSANTMADLRTGWIGLSGTCEVRSAPRTDCLHR